MITKDQIRPIIENNIDSDQFIVEIDIRVNNSIFVAIDGFKGVTIQDCVKLSRAIA